MPVWTPELLDCLERSVLCWLATVDEQGWPSVSPKETFAADGQDRLLIAHIASGNSVRNIRAHPRVSVAMVDVFEQAGFTLYGTAAVRLGEAMTPHDSQVFAQVQEQGYPVRGVIEITITEVRHIVAPSSWLFPDRDSRQTRAAVVRNYLDRLDEADS